MSPPVSLSLASASSESSRPQAVKLKQGDALRIYASDALDNVEEVKFQSLPHQRFRVTVPTMRAATNGGTEWVKHILELTADETGEVQLKIQMRDGVKSYEGATGQIRARQAEYTEQELADLQASHDVDSNSAAQSPAQSKESSEVSISQLNVKFSNSTDAAATPALLLMLEMLLPLLLQLT